ncbi:glycosyltransferase [Providencia rettgeri]|uniref:glycosyltransferase n=1 Tax=Providencia sp. PROV269 TaxID=2949957 RepID=UPI00234A7044|nr:glycosyltransferase [Providencia sp. PROV269]ELR5297355.1 glycosyltransferase [Providencia rettgeri]MCL0013803.1 glycosyltransferase family 4 protein [Providencia rettgeri]
MKKRILIVTPRFPYPVIGGDKLRIYQLSKELSKYYSVTLVSLCESQLEYQMDLPNDGVFDQVHKVYLPKWKSILNTFLSLPSKTPLQVAYYKSKSFNHLIHQLAKNHDVIIPHLIRVAGYVTDINKPKIIEMTDAISMNYTRISNTKNNAGLKGLIYRIEKNRLLNYERNIAKYFQYSVLVSKYDKNFLFKDNSELYSRTLVCSNGVDLTNLPYNFIPGGYKLIFIGNMHSAQNFDAAFWFAKNVMPLLLSYGPYEFHIIGKIPEDSARKLRQLNGIIVTGAVDSVARYAEGAVAGICSVRLAAGVQNKILEYMALGIPTITSSIGLEGLEAKKDIDILVSDTSDNYINQIIKLNSDPLFAKNLAENAYKYVQENHSWSSKLTPLISTINNILR